MMSTQAALQVENIADEMLNIAKAAKAAYRKLATATSDQKNQALNVAADALEKNTASILEANAKDMNFAKEKGISGALLDRLALDEDRIKGIASGLRAIAKLPDPVGKHLDSWEGNNNGLTINKVSVPLGVIGIIYESRPNVTADAGGLCLKSGNAAILRGGSESLHSSTAIVAALHEGLKAAGLPAEAVQLVPTRDRAAVGEMLTLVDYIDIIVPRGGQSLTRRIAEESRIPTIQHLDGNCHSYIHSSADVEKAVNVVSNAKMRRTGICGATESIVIDASVADTILPKLVDRLSELKCEVRGDAAAQKADSRIVAATEDDWGTEYLDAIVSVKTVADIEEAIEHVNRYSSHHTDAIIAEDEAATKLYAEQIDSAIVMVNSSTQFADGGEFGMGAEIGISTGRLHARGPVGCDQLTTYKYVVSSDGATRS
ncbi:MAG: glutamate-5-semialdehyde dehydrogenase [Rickettsiales bacterium]|nr:glutamate-5-semialdehyde dehydrogenase [Rickettsiales bacterium]